METIISVGLVYFWKSSKILHSYVDAFINIGLIVGDGFGLAVVNRIFSSASVTKIGFQIDFKNNQPQLKTPQRNNTCAVLKNLYKI